MSEPLSPQKVTKLNRLFVGFVAQRPWVAIALGLALALAFVPGLRLIRADFTHTGFFWKEDPKLKRFEAFERRFGNDDAVSIAIHSPSGVFDLDTARLIQELTARMWKLPEVIRVESLANFNWVHADGDDIRIEAFLPDELDEKVLAERKAIALAHETLPGFLVSKDATVALVFGRVAPNFERKPNPQAIVTAARALVAEMQRGDNELFLFGGPTVTYAFEEVSQRDVERLLPQVLLLAAFFLFALLRSAVGTLLPFLLVALAILAAFGMAGYTGLVQTATSTAIPSIIIAVGIADTVHILVTFFGALRGGMARRDAAHHALTKNLLATFLTSLTTAVGFFSFGTSKLAPVANLGIMAGFGTLIAWLEAQLLVGGLLFVLPIRAKPLPPERAQRVTTQANRLVDFIARRKVAVIGVAALLTGGSIVLSLGVEVNSDPIKYFKKGYPLRTAADFIASHLGNARSLELTVDSGREEGIKDPVFLAKVDTFQRWLEAQPEVTRALSIVDILKATHRSLNGDNPAFYKLPTDGPTIAQELLLYTLGLPQGMDVNDRITVRNDALRLTVFNNMVTSRQTVAAVASFQEKARELGLDVEATGKYYLYQDTNEYVVESFLGSLWSSTLIIGLIMAIFLRSALLGVISMIPNVVPLFAGGVLLRVIGQPLDLGTVLVASVCLGISIDDTSHVLANYAYLRRQGEAALPALRSVMAHSGPALLSTNGILVTAFASFATATFVPNVNFGILTAFILTVALIADLFLTPALLLALAARRR